jgi:hypothetical protein
VRISKERQQGLSAFFIGVILILAAVGIVALVTFSGIASSNNRSAELDRNFEKIDDAMRRYVALNGRLPCPADPRVDAGVAVPATASITCTYPGAVAGSAIPWVTLGLSANDVADPWGSKITYRPYTGAVGSVTQAEGASLMNCNTNTDAVAGTTASGTCQPTHSTLRQAFLDVPRYAVDDNGTPVTHVAYVLISHGPTGLGAYTTSGIARSAPVNSFEQGNVSVTATTFTAKASPAGAAPGTPNYFDDVVHFVRVDDLAPRAGLDARPWPGPSGGAIFNAQTIAAALNQTTVSPGDLGTATINFGTVTATATSGSNLSLISDATSGQGLGSSGIFGGYLNNFENNSINFQFGFDATKFAVTLGDFGTYSGFAERAQFIFRDGSGGTLASVTASACNPDGGIASYALTVVPSPPVSVATSQADSGGSLSAAATFAYRVSAYNGIGESLPAAEVMQPTAAGAGNNHTITLSWPAVAGATGYRIYGRSAAAELFLADVGSALTFTDTGGLTPLGAMPTGAGFRSVEVRPMSAINGSGTTFFSFFFVNEVKGCAGSATCTTSLAAPANNCP